ncbi:copper(I)-binding protein [Sinorhizobium kostiense]|uniref:Copper(I)-binding protein n=1 Tax=Sinorhizobium kostiense TaxID=76747 RepID=A0ABS4R6Q3_9HYPH|nr:copper(I)-binding protein [Sinorhizobium kostiense]
MISNTSAILAAAVSLVVGMAHAHGETSTAPGEDNVRTVLQPGHDVHSRKSAPTAGVIVASGKHAGHTHEDEQHVAEPVSAGDLEISAGAAKAMPPGAKVGGGGLTVKNNGNADDRLVAVESPSAGRVELHEMTMENDVMKMRKLENGIVIPAGQTVELKTGGLHLMFMEVVKPFAEGDSVPVTLIFERAGKVEFALPVGTAAGGSSEHQHN